MNKEYLRLSSPLLLIVIVLLILAYEDECHESHVCAIREDFKSEEWSGIVKRKYIDSSNHNAEAFEISGSEPYHVMFRDRKEFYASLAIGDSVVKILNTDTVKVYRQGQVYRYQIYFGCLEQK
jgi:hypothetical protein